MRRGCLMVWLALIAGPVAAQIAVPPDAQIVVLGEVHGNAAHHAEQARLVAAVQPGAVVWEMLTQAQAARADGADRSDAASFGAALGWAGTGWPDFTLYHPIVLAAGDAQMLGGAVPRDQLRAAMDQGALAVWGDVGPGFDPALVLGPLAPADLAARRAEQARAHCDALPPEMLGGMVEAQRLRDAKMAAVALAALDAGRGPVVIITGAGHARADVGIPAMIAATRPAVRVWALGQTEGAAPSGAPYDAVNATPDTGGADPCEAFR